MQNEPIILRLAQPTDATGLAHVHVNTWRTAYKGIIHDEILAGLSLESSAQRWTERLGTPEPKNFVWLIEIDGNVVGFSSGGPERDGDSVYLGEVYALYLLPEYQHRGLGRKLVEASARSLLADGMTNMLIWVLRENPSCRFYEAIGGKFVREREVDIRGQNLMEVAYGWNDFQGLIKKDARTA
jgi:ribosomal protein S18 acetylase RimI-like enzyme